MTDSNKCGPHCNLPNLCLQPEHADRFNTGGPAGRGGPVAASEFDHTTHHAHCGGTLRDRAAQALLTGMGATWGEAPTLVDARDLIDGVFNSAGVDDEAQRLRAELGRIAEICGDDESNPDHAVALVRRQEHEDRTTIDRLIGEREQTSRRAEAAEAERDGLRVLAGERADQRDFAYRELDKLCAERDVARAERDRWRRLAGEQENQRITQEVRADTAERERDELQQKLDLTRDANERREDEQDGNAVELIRQRDEARAERDQTRADISELQARICDALAMLGNDDTPAPIRCDSAAASLAPDDDERDLAGVDGWKATDDSSETEDLVLTPQETREFEQELLESRLQDQAGEFCRVDPADTAKRERDELQPGQPLTDHSSDQGDTDG